MLGNFIYNKGSPDFLQDVPKHLNPVKVCVARRPFLHINCIIDEKLYCGCDVNKDGRSACPNTYA